MYFCIQLNDVADLLENMLMDLPVEKKERYRDHVRVTANMFRHPTSLPPLPVKVSFSSEESPSLITAGFKLGGFIPRGSDMFLKKRWFPKKP